MISALILLATYANAASNDVMLSCAASGRSALYTGTQWEFQELNEPTMKTITVEGTQIQLTPYRDAGKTYVKIAADGQNTEVLATWGEGNTAALSDKIEVRCYFQHDD